MENLFVKASRLKLRIAYKGLISVEDLWDLDINTLDKLAIEYSKKVKLKEEESFIPSNVKKSLSDIKDELCFEILKNILSIKINEKQEKIDELNKKQEISRLQKILRDKKEENLKELSVEEIQKKIDELSK